MKVLIAEDDTIASRVLEAALRKLGHEVLMANDGESAWQILQTESVRAVVSDWQMPRLDGLDLCRRVRKREGDYVYFILLTHMEASEKNLEEATDAGVDDFLAKPINSIQLWMRLRVAERILGFTTEVRQLESFLPICGYCKKVRDDKNYWQQIEEYINTRTGTNFSHGVCPDCIEKVLRPQLAKLGVTMPPPSA
ncbi:MAG TPA: response regulator [Lacunisphaera sp.]|jgi:DNA-binding response OmpR family regulator